MNAQEAVQVARTYSCEATKQRALFTPAPSSDSYRPNPTVAATRLESGNRTTHTHTGRKR
eukprot:191646-Prorocentrum_minimum.AAC.1